MRLSQINETRARVLYRNNGDRVGYYANKKANYPFVMVVPVNDNRFIIVSITRAGIKQYEELMKRDYYSRSGRAEPLQPSERDLKQEFMAYSLASDGSFNKYPEYFVEEDVDRSGLFKSLVNKHRISTDILGIHFGEVPDMDDDERHGDAIIMMAGSTTKANVNKLKKGLDELKVELQQVGLDSLVSGKFRVASFKGRKAAATYQYGSGITNLDPRGFGKGIYLQSLVHEMGHKWEDVSGLENEIVKKFMEVRGSGHTFSGKPDLDLGDHIVLSGQQFKKYHGYIFTIVGFKSSGIMIKGINPKKNMEMSGTMPPDMFIRGGVEMADGSGDVPIVGGDVWFPSNYSTTDHHEFFAENFMRYVDGTASDEVREWMDTLPKP